MSAVCDGCGAFDPGEDIFKTERIPFRGRQVLCPNCHAKLEQKVLLGVCALNATFGLAGLVFLRLEPSSEVGRVFVRVFLFQLMIYPSIIVHEFAHAFAATALRLGVIRIWIGSGKVLFSKTILGFDTDFKMIPLGGFAFLTHGFVSMLRLRYLLAILAGPLANALILCIALRFVSWGDIHMDIAIPYAAIFAASQGVILVENLVPYRVQTSMGCICTDGYSLFQLAFKKNPQLTSCTLPPI